MLHLLSLLWSWDWQHTTYCCSFIVCPGIFISAVSLLYSPSHWNTPARELLEYFIWCITFPQVKPTCVFYRVCYVPVLHTLRHASPVCPATALEPLAPSLSFIQSLKSNKEASFGCRLWTLVNKQFSLVYTASQDGNTLRKTSQSWILRLVLVLYKCIESQARKNNFQNKDKLYIYTKK